MKKRLRAESFEAIRYFTNRYFGEYISSFLNAELQEQRIVDGHGDLHLEHIHVSPDNICIYDCIELNERFGYWRLGRRI
ncbi:MAG: hypothetical protein U5J95_01310 [Balneolaceae bacterium]|nr:hypothetical protein [Balneolaceae bacterium]